MAIMRKLKHIYAYICLSIITLGALLIAFWLLWPVNVIHFDEPVTVDKKVYHPGDQIIYTISYCKYDSRIGTIYRSLVNSTIITYTPVTNNLPVGCRKTKKTDLHIPENTEEGVYHLENTIIYKINPIRDFVASWRSEEFEVKY
jgi:hypothetical protein